MSSSNLLELTLISAQNLKTRRPHSTYAIAWVDPTCKLRTHVDPTGGPNPTWNEKLIFKVPSTFLLPSSSLSAAFHVEIYASGLLLDSLLGSVRFLVGDHHLLSFPPGTPSFAAVGVRRPSGRFEGVLNLGMVVIPEGRVAKVVRERLERKGAARVCGRENVDPGRFWRRRSAPVRRSLGEVLRERNWDDDVEGTTSVGLGSDG